MKKPKKIKLKNRQANGTAKGKTFRMVDSNGKLAPRDCKYPLDGPGLHSVDDAEVTL